MARLLGGTRIYGNSSIDGILFLGNTAANSIGNSTGFFTTGRVNASSFTVGTSVIANATNFGVGNSAPVTRLQIGGNYGLVATTIASSNSININCASGNYFLATANASAAVISFTNAPANSAYGFVLVLSNGGSNSVTWANTPKWPGGVSPTLTASGVDVLTFFTNDAGATWRGNLSILNSA